MKKIYSTLLVLGLCLGLNGCAIFEVGDMVVSGAADVVSAGVSVVSTGVKAVGKVIDAVTPDFKSK
jgi:hypothetical protein